MRKTLRVFLCVNITLPLKTLRVWFVSNLCKFMQTSITIRENRATENGRFSALNGFVRGDEFIDKLLWRVTLKGSCLFYQSADEFMIG